MKAQIKHKNKVKDSLYNTSTKITNSENYVPYFWRDDLINAHNSHLVNPHLENF